MKKFTSSVLFIFLFLNFVTAQNCQNPVSATVFQTNFNQIAIQPTNQKKLDKASVFASSNCMLASQVKTMAQLFTEDSYRLEFCETAYPNTFDQVNFYDVYDAFTNFSYAFRLNDYIHALPPNIVVSTNTNTTTTTTTTITEPTYPNIAYPSSANYTGKKGCSGPPLTDSFFKNIAQNVFNQPTDESKQLAIQNAVDQNCLDFSEVMKLISLLKTEDFRLQVLENTFAKVYDEEHYQSGIELFTNTQMQANWTAWAQNFLAPPPPPPVVCEVTATDFNSIMNNIKSKPFTDDKMKVVDMMTDRCFSVAQIKTISQQFPFDEEKMKTMKELYAKCPDQNNYYSLVDELTFSPDKDNMRNFIKNGGK